jgi:hypothetical protein
LSFKALKSLKKVNSHYQILYVVLGVKKGSKTMIELNEQELEQVAGGTYHYGSHADSNGGATADYGIAKSSTYSSSTVSVAYGYSTSSAGTKSSAVGYDVNAGGASSSGSGASY